jgi:hypothetical protein
LIVALNILFLLAELGDPVDDLAVATVLMVVGGQLILLRPRKVKLPVIPNEFKT